MKKKLFVLIVVLLASLLTACGGSTSQGGVTTTPSAGTIKATISGLGKLSGDFSVYGIAADDTAVWVHNGDTGTLLRTMPFK